MLKDYLKERGISVYSLTQKCNIPYSTLSDLSNGKVQLDNCRFGMIRLLASELGLDLDEFAAICTSDELTVSTELSGDIVVRAKGKSYFAVFEYEGTMVNLELCRVSEESSYYIEDIARWRVDKYTRKRRMEEHTWNTILCGETK